MSYSTRKGKKQVRHDLSLGDKVEVIRMIDNRKSQNDIARLINCSQSQISRILSKREEILVQYEQCENPAEKRPRFFSRLRQQQARRESQSTPNMADMSTSPRPPSEGNYDGNEQNSETPNNGWLEYWKNRSSNYSSNRSFSEYESEYSPYKTGAKRGPKGRPKPSSNKESRISNQMLDILKNYDVCDVYCADELALHYDAMPNLDSADNDDNEEGDGEGEKKDGEASTNQKQITVLLTSNVTGSDKREPLIIENAQESTREPVKIEGCQRAKAPHAWMTSDVYHEFLLALDYDMRTQRRYILLLVDNVPPHDSDAARNLEHVRVLYMRSYTTPFFHGIFYSVRAHYRKQILLKLLAGEERKRLDKSLSVDIDVEEAVNMLKLAWKSVSPQDVVQCFSKAGLCAPHIHGLPETSGDELPELPEGLVSDEQYEDFINVDVDAQCAGDASLTSVECRILSDLRQQGFTDIGLELPDDAPGPFSPALSNSGVKVEGGATSMPGGGGGFRPGEKRGGVERGGSGEVERSLSTLRSFLEQRSLHLHNLHALEAQIYSCHSGGH